METSYKRFDMELKAALHGSRRSMRSIAIEAGVTPPSVNNFVGDRGGITAKTASSLAKVVMPDYGNTRFISGTNEIFECLTQMLQSSRDEVKLIGNEIFAFGQLEHMASQGVNYKRILIGDYVSPSLGGHLRRVASFENVEIYQTPVQHYSPMLIADGRSILLLPNGAGFDGGFHTTDPQGALAAYFENVVKEARTQNITSRYQRQ